MTIKDLCKDAHATAWEKGWYAPAKSFPECVALYHSELSEALESWRDGERAEFTQADSDSPNKPEGWAVELADCIIRIADTCAFYGVDLESVLKRKMDYNRSREYRHGGKIV